MAHTEGADLVLSNHEGILAQSARDRVALSRYLTKVQAEIRTEQDKQAEINRKLTGLDKLHADLMRLAQSSSG